MAYSAEEHHPVCQPHRVGHFEHIAILVARGVDHIAGRGARCEMERVYRAGGGWPIGPSIHGGRVTTPGDALNAPERLLTYDGRPEERASRDPEDVARADFLASPLAAVRAAAGARSGTGRAGCGLPARGQPRASARAPRLQPAPRRSTRPRRPEGPQPSLARDPANYLMRATQTPEPRQPRRLTPAHNASLFATWPGSSLPRPPPAKPHHGHRQPTGSSTADCLGDSSRKLMEPPDLVARFPGQLHTTTGDPIKIY
jgi:hypothetical protein